MSYQRRLFLLITASSILKLLLSTSTELGADEIYFYF